MKYAFIREHRRLWPVGCQCRVLGVSRGGYYDWLGRPPSARRRRREELAARAREVFVEHEGRYGSPRVHRELAGRGVRACRNTVARVMRDSHLSARKKRRFVPKTTDSAHGAPVAANLLCRSFKADGPDRRWVCDITYVPTDQGWLYLAAVMDLYSRKVVGWATADHMKAALCVEALEMALTHRRPPAGLLHHSDRGIQYASEDYQQLLADHGIICSMSGKGNCYDNAAMESLWATVKTEEVHRRQYATRQQATDSIFEYIEIYYNRKRLHSALGYLSPAAFEAAFN